jgi:hypothetical protein
MSGEELVVYASWPFGAPEGPPRPVTCRCCGEPAVSCRRLEKWFAEPVTVPQGSDRTEGSDG